MSRFLQKIKSKPSFSKRILAISIALLFVIQVAPTIDHYAGAQSSGLSAPKADYGIAADLNELFEEKEKHTNSPEILAETEEVLRKLEPREQQRESKLEFYNETKSVNPHPLNQTPEIYDIVEDNENVNNTTILDFILGQPLNYWFHTKYGENHTWTKGLLRRSLLMPPFNLEGWLNIDVDNDASNGNEVRARIVPAINEITPEFSIEPFPIGPAVTMDIEAALILELERLEAISLPFELDIVKSVSYEGINYIIIFHYEFPTTPSVFTSLINVDSIRTTPVRQAIYNFILNTGELDANIANVSGPYTLVYTTSDKMEELVMNIGMAKVVDYKLKDRTWAEIDIRKAEDQSYIPYQGNLVLDSIYLTSLVDTLNWTSGNMSQAKDPDAVPIDLILKFMEDKANLTFSRLEALSLSKRFDIGMDFTRVERGKNVSSIHMKAEDIVPHVHFENWFFPYYIDEKDVKRFNLTEVFITDLPTELYLELTSEINRGGFEITIENSPLGIAATFVDRIMVQLVSRLNRVGRNLREMPSNVMGVPEKKGWIIASAPKEPVGSLEFRTTSGSTLDYSGGDYLGFYNDTSFTGDPRLSSIGVSGRLSQLKQIDANFEQYTSVEAKMESRDHLLAYTVDGDDFAYLNISNLPTYFRLDIKPDFIHFSSIDETGNPKEADRIDNMAFRSEVEGQHMKMDLVDLPYEFTLLKEERGVKLLMPEFDHLGEFSFLMTNRSGQPIYDLSQGNFAFVHQTKTSTTASGRLFNLKKLAYDPGENGALTLLTKEPAPFGILLESYIDEPTVARMVFDPLPSNFTIDLPGVVNSSVERFPESVNITGVVAASASLFSIADLGQTLSTVMANISQNIIDRFGAFGSNFSFSYDLESLGATLDVVASIERGEFENLGELDWTHGLIMAQEEDESGKATAFGSHVYLQGLPRKAEITTNLDKMSMHLKIDFTEYAPRYDWLHIDTKNIQGRDTSLYINGLRAVANPIDFSFETNLTSDLRIGGAIVGDFKARLSKELGEVWLSMSEFEPTPSSRDIYMPKLPSEMDIDINISYTVDIDYSASSPMEYMYVAMDRFVDDDWYTVNAILHDLPTRFHASLLNNPDFEMDKPFPLQGLPDMTVTSSDRSLDFVINIQGKSTGQRGDYEIFLENVGDISTELKGDRYTLRSEGGLGFIRVCIKELPLVSSYHLKRLELLGSDLAKISISVKLVFGVYPYFVIDNTEGGGMELNVLHRVKVFGSWKSGKIALADIQWDRAGDTNLPVGTIVHINGMSSTMEREGHTLLPAPMTSLVHTYLGSGG